MEPSLIYTVGQAITTCILAAGAVYLAAHGQNGWGWMLFGAIFVAGFGLVR